MSAWEFRSRPARRQNRRDEADKARGGIWGLLRRAGTPAGEGAERFAGLETLESRVLLAGDHPSFNDVFDNPTDTATEIVLNGAGEGSDGGEITPAGDNDMFRFTAPSAEFVTIWADAINTDSGLDSQIAVYTRNADGTMNNPVLVISGTNNGLLTGGLNTDGWVGFVAEAGREYFVRVSGAMSGTGSTGTYDVRVDALPSTFPALNGTSGEGSVSSSISRVGQDIIYKVTIPSSELFNSLATASGQGNAADFDVRLDLYNAAGQRIVGDSQAGFQTDAFMSWKANPEAVYYLRVRGDEFDLGNPLSTGNFTARIDAIAEEIELDPVTRLGSAGGAAGGTAYGMFRFTAQGTGLAIITMQGAGLPPTPDPALHIYSSNGQEIGFNDDLIGVAAQLEIRLVGGQDYYLVAEDFDDATTGGFAVNIEANATFPPTTTVDDHADAGDYDNATGVVWGDPQSAPDYIAGGTLADRNQIVFGHGTGRIHDTGDTDLFVFTPPVDMLGGWEGKDDGGMPPLWLPDHRPATRLQLLILGENGSFLQPGITVFDSTLTPVFTNAAEAYIPLLPGAQPETSASGMWDPASYDPETTLANFYLFEPVGAAEGIEVWGGESYYLQVEGASKGRYRFVIMADAFPDTQNGDGHWVDNNSLINELPGAGEWTSAPEIILNNATGDMTETGGINGVFDGYFERAYDIGNGDHTQLPPGFNPFAASDGIVILQESGLMGIETYEDTDLFLFTAPDDGTAEIRIQTTGLEDFFNEFITDGEDDPMNPTTSNVSKEKTYNSLLDSALRIFNFDREQIAFNDDNPAITGPSEVEAVGSAADITFSRRDARVVFPVQRGERYFIQIESGQLGAIQSGDTEAVSWKNALGSYQLHINTQTDLDFVDDHINGETTTNIQATAIPIADELDSATNGQGSVAGEIDHNAFNATDTDLFTFKAPGDGTATLTVRPPGGGTLSPIVQIFSATGVLVAQNTAAAGQATSVNVPVLQGERYFVRVGGAASTEGDYTLEVDNIPFVDDHASLPDFTGATALDVLDFQGYAVGSGSIEAAGDVDIFKFDANEFAQVLTPADLLNGLIGLTVTGTSGTLQPTVRIYEVQIDRNDDGFPLGGPGETHPVLVQIGGDITGTDDTASASFSITAPPRTPTISDLNTAVFNTYYVVISGADLTTEKGDYEIRLDNFRASDDHADAGQYEFVDIDDDGVIAIDGESGDGEGSGELEVSGDTDLFKFTAAASGRARVSVLSPAESLLWVRVRIFEQTGVDDDGAPVVAAVTDVLNGAAFRDGPDTAVSTARFTFEADRDTIYFIQVEGRSGGVVKTADTGAYSVDVNGPAADDHANADEWDLATEINLSRFTGDGLDTGVIHSDFEIDTDLFTFTSVIGTNLAITLDTASSGFVPTIQLFGEDHSDLSGVVVDNGTGDQDPAEGRIRIRRSIAAAGEVYFVQVSANSGAFLPGSYTLQLTGDAPPPGPDDHADEGEWNDASGIEITRYNGNGSIGGELEEAGDTDLFTFTSRAGSEAKPQKTFIQVLTPSGSSLDVTVRVFRADGTEITNEVADLPGVNANFRFTTTAANEQFFVLVDGAGNGTGDYTVNVDTAPETHYLYFPEGFTNSNIREYVTINNPNDYEVSFTIRIRYQNTSLSDLVVAQGTVSAGRRSGVTISNGPNGRVPGITAGRAYAIIVESDGPLGASVAHYDFGASLGETFASEASTTWSFARGQKFRGEVEDFLVFYNPNAHAVKVTLTAYAGTEVVGTLSTTVDALRRGGWSFDDETALPVGEFAFVVTSEAVTADPDDPHIGIVAALSHYDLANTTGYSVLGDPTGGSTRGVIPSISQSEDNHAEISFFNPGATGAVVTIRISYAGSGLNDQVRVLPVPARSVLTLTGEQLAMVEGQAAGLEYESTAPLVVLASERQGTIDSNATIASTQLATGFFFGDAFINAGQAGVRYFETLGFYNPGTALLPVTVKLSYFDGTVIQKTVNVGPDRFAKLDLHELEEILERGGNNYFAIEVTAARPFAASMSHYDLVLGGGWSTTGVPFGLTNDLATL